MTPGQGQAAAGTAAPQREEAAPAAGASGATGGEATAAAAPLKKPAAMENYNIVVENILF